MSPTCPSLTTPRKIGFQSRAASSCSSKGLQNIPAEFITMWAKSIDRHRCRSSTSVPQYCSPNWVSSIEDFHNQPAKPLSRFPLAETFSIETVVTKEHNSFDNMPETLQQIEHGPQAGCRRSLGPRSTLGRYRISCCPRRPPVSDCAQDQLAVPLANSIRRVRPPGKTSETVAYRLRAFGSHAEEQQCDSIKFIR